MSVTATSPTITPASAASAPLFHPNRLAGTPLSLAPEAPRRDISAFTHGLELLPDHGVVHLGAIERLRGKAAIRAGDDILASDQVCKPDQPLGDPFGVLHDVAGVGDHAG